jgi:hypothetical protein
MSDHPPTDEELRELIEEAEEARERFEAYDGDEYFIRTWVDEGTTRDQAIQEIQEPFTLSLLLSLNGLEFILADKYATAGLKTLLIDRHPVILAELARYAQRRKSKSKPGPRPANGQYIKDRIMELRDQGLTHGQIAKIIYRDPAKRSTVSAHLSQARKKADSPSNEVPKAIRRQ